MATADQSFSQNFARNLRISSQDDLNDDPNYLIRSASAPPARQDYHGGESVNFMYSNNTNRSSSSGTTTKSSSGNYENTTYSTQHNTQPHQMYPSYIPSPGLHPVSIGMIPTTGYYPQSAHLYPSSAGQEATTNSPYHGPTSMNAFSQPGQFDYFHIMNGQGAVQQSPVLTAIPSPYSHPLLPQSLLGASGIGTPPDPNSKNSSGNSSMAFYAAQQYSPGLGPGGGDYYGQYYGQGFLSSSSGAIHMPLMAQLPPAATQSTSNDAPISRYLSESTEQEKQKSSVSLDTQWSTVASDNSKKSDVDKRPVEKQSNVSTGSTLLEELRNKMKHTSPTNGGGRHRHHSSSQDHYSQPSSQNNYYNNGSHSSKGAKSPTNMSNGVSWGLGAIKGQVCEFAKDQHGSRFIQQQLESPMVSAEEKQSLFEEVLPVARMLCTDVFGNYVIQKLLDPNVGTPEQQEQLCIIAIKGNMIDLSMHMYGCRVVQKLVEKVFGEEGNDTRIRFAQPQYKMAPGAKLYDPEFQDSLLEELSPHIVKCVQDQNGNHVVQKCIEQIRPINRISFILDAFRGNICSMARHPYGCRVVQRVLENCEEERVSTSLSELIAEIQTLVQDQYGNYVIQHIIEGSRDRHPNERKRLIRAVQDNVLPFSMHKFASNVVEKCLQYGDAQERREIIGRMLESPSNGSNGCPLQHMMKDPYANYVVQKVMDMAEPDQREKVVVLVRENAAALKRLTYGKHILARLDKIANDGGYHGNHHKGKRQQNTSHNYY